MTIWTPDLSGSPGSKYLAIARAIARDVKSGRLAPGSRLPTHRDLARRLGVTVGTVSRGYAEAHRRGLVSGEVGRGTFVRGASPAPSARTSDRALDLSVNAPPPGADEDSVRTALATLRGRAGLGAIVGYAPPIGAEPHRRAGARWLRRLGLEADPEEIVVTAGAQHGTLLALSVLAEPGDLLLAEGLTYPGLKPLAHLLRLRLEGIPLDREGLRPDALEEACKRRPPRVLYCAPTLHNPTSSTMSEARRREVASIADRYGVAVLEVDLYGFLLDDPPAPIASFAAEAYLVTSLSKCAAPGLRVGYLRAPRARIEALAGASMATTMTASPLTAEIASLLLEKRTVEALVRRRRSEARDRQKLARRVLRGHLPPDSRPECFHLWLPLPESWRTAEFVAEAGERGVAVAPSEIFAVGRAAAPHAVRLGLGAAPDLDRLESGLTVLADLLSRSPSPSVSGT